NAAGLCLGRTHYHVDVEHLLVKLFDISDGDAGRIARHYGVDSARLARDLTRALDRLKTGNDRTPALSPRILRWLREAWVLASLEFGASQLRSGHLLATFVGDDDLARLGREISAELQKIGVDDLRQRLPDLVSGSSEDTPEARAAAGDGG